MSRRPSYAQLEALAEFLEENAGIARGFLRSSSAKAETKRKWASLATSLNALGGAHKDGVGWAKYWTEKKCALKKSCAQRNISMRQTGGGPGVHVPPLSELDRRLVEVMGGEQFASGDPGLSVDPFPDFQIDSEPLSVTQVPPETLQCPSSMALPQNEYVETLREIDTERERSPIRNFSPVQRPFRRRRRAAGGVEADIETLAQIEARRVDAEHITANALDRIADALTTMANAMSSLTTAMVAFMNRPPS